MENHGTRPQGIEDDLRGDEILSIREERLSLEEERRKLAEERLELERLRRSLEEERLQRRTAEKAAERANEKAEAVSADLSGKADSTVSSDPPTPADASIPSASVRAAAPSSSSHQVSQAEKNRSKAASASPSVRLTESDPVTRRYIQKERRKARVHLSIRVLLLLLILTGTGTVAIRMMRGESLEEIFLLRSIKNSLLPNEQLKVLNEIAKNMGIDPRKLPRDFWDDFNMDGFSAYLLKGEVYLTEHDKQKVTAYLNSKNAFQLYFRNAEKETQSLKDLFSQLLKGQA